jgi:uncharacterized membrane protein
MDVILTVAGIIVAVGTIIAALISVYRVARRVDDAIGKDSKGRTISDRLERVEHQLWENGGSSLADRVNKINEMSSQTQTEVLLVKDILVALVGKTSK